MHKPLVSAKTRAIRLTVGNKTRVLRKEERNLQESMMRIYNISMEEGWSETWHAWASRRGRVRQDLIVLAARRLLGERA